MWYVHVNEIQVACFYSRFDASAWVVALLQACRDRYSCGNAASGPCGKGTCGPDTRVRQCREWFSYTRQIETAYGTAEAGVALAVPYANQRGTAVVVNREPGTGFGEVALLRDYANGTGHVDDAGVVVASVVTNFDTFVGDARPLISVNVRFLNGHPTLGVARDDVASVGIEKLASVKR